MFQRLFDLLVGLINRLNEVDLEVKRSGKTMFTLPVIAFVLLLIFAGTFESLGFILSSILVGIPAKPRVKREGLDTRALLTVPEYSI